MNTKDVGESSEAQIMASLLKSGKVVLKPFGDNLRYDLVVDDNGAFVRIQCKTGRLKGNVIEVSSCSSSYHRGGKKRDYRGQIEMFGVYCPQNEKVYFISVYDVGTVQFTLRTDSSLVTNGNRTHFAMDHEFKGSLDCGRKIGV